MTFTTMMNDDGQQWIDFHSLRGPTTNNNRFGGWNSTLSTRNVRPMIRYKRLDRLINRILIDNIDINDAAAAAIRCWKQSAWFALVTRPVAKQDKRASFNIHYSALWIHCALSCGAVYCNRSCLCVCVFVGGSVTTITRICVHRSSPNWVCR